MARFVVFGGTGDLMARYLLPALARLLELDLLPPDTSIVGAARDEWDDERFAEWAADALGEHGEVEQDAIERMRPLLSYRKADATDEKEVGRAVRGEGPVIAYLALPPAVFPAAVKALAAAGLEEGSRVVVEKPFGEDLASARSLNDLLHEHFPEEAVYRSDHFLGHQTAQNILGLRFANRTFEPLWNRDHVERVEIIWDETLALEGRAGYYDSTGALRDMLQNHLLQLLTLLAMEPPATLSERDLRDRKAELLRAVRTPTLEEAREDSLRARYTAGTVEGREVPSYVAEEGVDPERRTETLAQMTVHIDNWRWAGVPFRLRSGKALAEKRYEMVLHYRPVPHLAFGQREQPAVNRLILGLEPDRISLDLNVNGAGDVFCLEPTRLSAELAPQGLPPYGRLLLDVLEGDQTFTIRDDEAEESWRIVEPILQAWKEGLVPLREYEAGAHGVFED
jgi:glucose-6-phosphate 1-dehydrogenase